MDIISSILLIIQLAFCAIYKDVKPNFWLECHQIGDNLYNCDGGHS